MSFRRVGPNQTIERGQFRVAKSGPRVRGEFSLQFWAFAPFFTGFYPKLKTTSIVVSTSTASPFSVVGL